MTFSKKSLDLEAHWTRTQETDSILSIELNKVDFFIYSARLYVPTFPEIQIIPPLVMSFIVLEGLAGKCVVQK